MTLRRDGDDVPGDPNYYVDAPGRSTSASGSCDAAAVARIDYSRLRELKYGIYALLWSASSPTQALGSVARGSRRAIELPFFDFQASELGKVLLVVALAGFLVDRGAQPAGPGHDRPRHAR